jgi:hypothetical protein
MNAIELRPYRSGWKVFEAPGVEPFYLGNDAKAQALDYAKHRQRSNARAIRILDVTGGLLETISPAPKGFC